MSFVSGIRVGFASLSRERWWFLSWTGLGALGLALLAVPGPRAGKAALRLAEAHAGGQPGSTVDYATHWVPRAAQGGLVVALLMLVGTCWLVRPLPTRPPVPARPTPGKIAGWALTGFTLLLMLFSGWANAPRLDFSLWGDEDATMRKSVVGQFQRNQEGKLAFDAPSWMETFFRYRDPNNHPLNSVLSRLSHQKLARDLTRPDGFYFDEKALRWPVFVAGLLGLAALAWVGWIMGNPALGGFAAALIGCHPWFVRYGVETRGYGFLFLFTPLALGCLIRAGQSGQWRWWISYGFFQFLILWSYPGAVHLLLALNASAICLVFFMKGSTRAWRQAQAGRWLTACALGAVLCTLMMLPLVQPLLYYLKSARMQGPMPPEWYPDAAGWLLTGMPWRAWDAANPLCWSWEQAAPGAWIIVGAGGIIGMLGLGVAGWWKQGSIGRALLPALALHAPLFVLQSYLSKGFIYAWYLVPALSGLVLLFTGILWFPWRRMALVVLLGIGGFVLLTAGAVARLRHHPVEAMRAGTKLTRPISLASDPRIDDVMTIDLVMSTRAYDPAMLPLPADDPELFKKYLAEADAIGKPLFVHLGSPGFADSVRPQVMALIRNPDLFESLAIFPGMDAPYTRQVFRYRSGAHVP